MSAELKYALIADSKAIAQITEFWDGAEIFIDLLKSVEAIPSERKEFLTKKFKRIVKEISAEIICETLKIDPSNGCSPHN